MKKKGFTLIELLVVIAIIAMLLAILMPALNKVKKIAQRVICGTNLKGLGTAQTVYGNDYDDEYAVQGRGFSHSWSDRTANWCKTGTGADKDWSVAAEMSIGASLYLLVREADVSPKSFVCPSSEQVEYSGKTALNQDIVDVWDFGHPGINEGPTKCVSYSYHMPYDAGRTGAISTGSKGRFAADARRSAAFAIMADQNPWYEETKLTKGPTNLSSSQYMDKVYLICPLTPAPVAPTDYSKIEPRAGLMIGNAYPHGREGQNVLYADGHNSWETRPDVGVKNDNIYTHQSTTTDSIGRYNRGGVAITNGTPTNAGDIYPINGDDSILVNDGAMAP